MSVLEEATKIAEGRWNKGGKGWKVILIIGAVVGAIFLVLYFIRKFLAPKKGSSSLYIPRVNRSFYLPRRRW